MSLPPASRLQRAFACLASTVLPRVASVSEASDRGIVVHAFLNNARAIGREEALTRVPPDYVHLCEGIDLARFPTSAEFGSELGLMYDVLTEEVRIVGRNVGKDVGERAPTEQFVAIDIDGVVDGTALAADTKTGHADVPPVKQNWQIRLGVLALARLHGLSSGRGAIVRLGDDGRARWEVDEFDAVDLDSYAQDLRERAVLILEAQEAGHAQPTMGPHCRNCGSIPYCEAQTGLARAVIRDPVQAVGSIEVDVNMGLTPPEAADLYERVKLARQVIGQLEAQLFLYAESHPLELSDGRIYGRVQKRIESLDGLVVRHVLGALHDEAVAEASCDFKTSKAAIDRALRPVYEERKRAGKKPTLKSLNEEALAAIRDAGGVTVEVRFEIREYVPRPSIGPGPTAVEGEVAQEGT